MSISSTRWDQLARAASRQYGAIGRSQALEYLTRAEVETRIRRGDLVPAARGVWRLPGAPEIWRQRVLVACLSVGAPAVARGFTAARVWELSGIAPGRRSDPIELGVPPQRSGKNRPGVTVRRVTLAATDVTTHLVIPVTTVARTLVDLAGCVSTDFLSTLTDDALRRGILTTGALERLQQARRPAVRRVASRRLEAPGGDSIWEDRVHEWIVEAGLPAPVRQYQVTLATRVAILDMAYPEERVGIEFDGFEWHGQRGRFDRDKARRSELAAAGWRLVEVTSAHAREEVVDRVGQALNQKWRPPKGAPLSERDG